MTLRWLRDRLGALLALCIVLRVGAWLVAPLVVPLLVLAFVTSILVFVFRGRGLS